MAEYIEREAIVEVAEQEGHISIDDILEIPAADVAPVVRGRWDDSFDGITPYCTACGRSHSGMHRLPPYCPNCGAKMEG